MSEPETRGIIDADALRLAQKEWELFRQVKNQGGPAPCQSERDTFLAMRCSQFMAWTPAVRAGYEADLDRAVGEGRNLLTEKYAYMMRYTHPEEFALMEDALPPVPGEKQALIDQITDVVVRWSEEMWHKYPGLMSTSRPLHTWEDRWGTSIETYTRGELATYGTQTLRLLLDHYKTMAERNINLHEVTDGFTAKLYGYDSLRQAEKMIREQAARSEQ